MNVPLAVSRYTRDVAMEKRAAAAGVAFHWSRMNPHLDPDSAWQSVRPSVLHLMNTSQATVAQLAERYVTDVLPATAPRAAAAGAGYSLTLSAWQGVAGDGRSVAGLADYATRHARNALAAGAPPNVALAGAGSWLTRAMTNVLADTHRGVEQMVGHSYGVGWYARMITGEHTCGRCIILAGRKYRMQHAFERHPGCDCEHIPSDESHAEDLTTNPHLALDALDDDALAKVLGSKANAQAYRDGADVNQLINAYRRSGDVSKAQIYGRMVSYTTEGMTVRGRGYQMMRERHGAMQDGRRRSNNTVRLMPSSIYEMSKDREDAMRLLRTYGWIL